MKSGEVNVGLKNDCELNLRCARRPTNWLINDNFIKLFEMHVH